MTLTDANGPGTVFDTEVTDVVATEEAQPTPVTVTRPVEPYQEPTPINPVDPILFVAIMVMVVIVVVGLAIKNRS